MLTKEQKDAIDIEAKGIYNWWNDIRYFKPNEFADKSNGALVISENLVRMLDQVREIYGKPITITSGYRTPEHNAEVGGVPDSAHVKGLAADIYGSNMLDLLAAVKMVGFKRVGVASNFIHVDIDTSKPQVAWTYGSGNADA